jgi:competence protein ComEC
LDVPGSNKPDLLRIGLDLFTRFRLAQAQTAPAAQGFDWSLPHNAAAGAMHAGISFRTLIESARASLAAEQDRWFPWGVVAFAAGDGLYFNLSVEPAMWLAIVAAILSLAALGAGWRVNAIGLRCCCAAVAALGLGFAAAKVRTEMATAPTIARDMGPLRLEGRVESVSDLIKGQRIILAPSRIGRAGTEKLPRRLRLIVRQGKTSGPLEPGQWISLVGILHPPPQPDIPGGYDFARVAFFNGIGGVGFAFGGAKTIAPARRVTAWQHIAVEIEGLRHTMTKRVRAALPGPNGAIAAALITGDRGAIDEDDNAAFRDSGLAHILSISGVHMALVGLGIFWALRALLALSRRLALTCPIKKWAAIAAIAASAFYLTISGGGAPPTRSFIMLAMMLLGVFFDRPALSMRPVALAGLAILAVTPESIFDAGFQMSFAAIIGLIALAEWYRVRPRDAAAPRPGLFSFRGVLRAVKNRVVAIMLATTVATLATAPFAIFHFDRAVGYSMLANVLAEAPVALIVMPAAAIAVILMPFGLDHWPFQVMGWGVQRMMDVAHWVGGLPGAVMLVPAWPLTALLLVVAGGLWIAIWRRQWRWLGFAPIAVGLTLGFATSAPDIVIAGDGRMAAVREAGGTLVILGRHPDEYTATQWLQREGDRRGWKTAMAGATCDDLGCVAHTSDGGIVALALRPGALIDDCARADVLVSAIPVRRECPHPRLVVDKMELLHNGATAVWFAENGVKLETVAEARGVRPWVAQYRRTRPTSRP